jgi:hypothetical protein
MRQAAASGTGPVGELFQEVRDLLDSKRHQLSPRMMEIARDGVMTVPQAERMRRYLRGCEDAEVTREAPPPPEPPLPGLRALRGVPDGWYATPSRTGMNDLDFWRVKVEEEGHWKGFSFVRRALGGPTDKKMRTEKVTSTEQRMALLAIHEYGMAESQELFSTSIDRCRKCSTLLTDKASRDARMGPDCRAKS